MGQRGTSRLSLRTFSPAASVALKRPSSRASSAWMRPACPPTSGSHPPESAIATSATAGVKASSMPSDFPYSARLYPVSPCALLIYAGGTIHDICFTGIHKVIVATLI